MRDAGTFGQKLPSKEKIYDSLTAKKLVIKIINILLKFEMYYKWKWSQITMFIFGCDNLFLADALSLEIIF